MDSLFDQLSEKLREDPRLTRRGGPRFDISLLLFNARDDIRRLWDAARGDLDRAKDEDRSPPAGLEAAVEALRPIFGERALPLAAARTTRRRSRRTPRPGGAARSGR